MTLSKKKRQNLNRLFNINVLADGIRANYMGNVDSEVEKANSAIYTNKANKNLLLGKIQAVIQSLKDNPQPPMSMEDLNEILKSRTARCDEVRYTAAEVEIFGLKALQIYESGTKLIAICHVSEEKFFGGYAIERRLKIIEEALQGV